MAQPKNPKPAAEWLEDEVPSRLPIIPLEGKVPAVKGWQRFVADEANLLLHFGRRGCNVGLRTGESGYVVIDTSRASRHLRHFTIHVLALTKIGQDGPYELYVPDLTRLEGEDDPRTQIADSPPLAPDDHP